MTPLHSNPAFSGIYSSDGRFSCHSLPHLLKPRLVGLLLLLSACRDQDEVRVGVVMSQDGAAAAGLAVEDIRASRMLGDQELSLEVIPESSGSAVPAITAAETLAGNHSVIGVVGHSNSASTLSASRIYNERRLTHIAPTSTAALLDEAGPFSFRLVGSDRLQAEFLAKAIQNHPSARIAIMFVNDDYGRGIHETLEDLLRSAGRNIVIEVPYAEGTGAEDMAVSARSISRNRPDILFWLGRSLELAEILPQLRRANPRLLVIASDGVQDQIAGNSSSVFSGIEYVHIGPVLSELKSVAELDRRFRERFDRPLSTQGLLSYEAVMLYAEAVRAVGSDREKIREYLASLGRERPAYKGLSGEIRFDSTGALRSSYRLMLVTESGTARPAPFPIP